MIAILALARQNWKQLVSLGLIVASLSFMGISLYNWGYHSCRKDWDKAINERNRIQEAQTEEIKKLSKEISDAKDGLSKKSDENLTQILLSVKNKPLYKITNGKCTFSTEFEKAYTDIVTYSKDKK